MADPVSIPSTPPLNPGVDYARLKAEAIDIVQQLSGTIWTDYNESDPGMTTLEQLCYALTELSYRAEFPVADFLATASGEIHGERHGLYIPKDILPTSPVTRADYRRLFIDRVPGVANAWLNRVEVDGVRGYYNIWLYVPGIDPGSGPCGDARRQADAANRAAEVYAAHRGLCENAAKIAPLTQIETTVEARAVLAPGARADETLARIYFALGMTLAPEPKRHSLREELAAGLTPDQIFDGPLMLGGFIRPDELGPQIHKMPVAHLARAIAHTPGVSGVTGVQATVDGTVYQTNAIIDVDIGDILVLTACENPSGDGFSITLTQDGQRCCPDPVRVLAELERLWEVQRRRQDLAADYGLLLGMPKGRSVDFRAYGSIQSQFPVVYGINAFGVSRDATPPRRGKAKQFKGYLLVFDQLMADFCAQLGHVRDLFSIDPLQLRTYFFQYLDRIVPDAAPLLATAPPDYRAGLPALIAEQDPALDRRNRFLDVLLALYAEAIGSDDLAGCGCEDWVHGNRIEAKLELLHRMVPATANRGRGFDILAPGRPGNLAGLVIKSSIMLGLDLPPLDPTGTGVAGLQIIADGEAGPAFARLVGLDGHIAAEFAPVSAAADPGARPTDGDLALTYAIAELRARRVTESFARIGSDAGAFRVGSFPQSSETALVLRLPGDSAWSLLHIFETRAAAEACARALAWLCRSAQSGGGAGGNLRQLYIFEHILFPGLGEQGQDGDPSFTITPVILMGPDERGDPGFKARAASVIRRNTPSHIRMLPPVLIGGYVGRDVQQLCAEWATALAGGGDTQRYVTALSRLVSNWMEE